MIFIQDSLSERNHQQEMVFSLADKNEPWADVCQVAYFL
jgi:head-tail adaptor